MAIEWEEIVPQLVGEAGLMPRPSFGSKDSKE
jgi:hypothetical protein